MPITIEKTLYHFDELTPAAKEKARDWYREATAGDPYTLDCVLDDAREILGIIGFDLDAKCPIAYSLAYSQGDFACIQGHYAYKAGALKAIKAYAPTDTKLHNLADILQDIQRRNFYALRATVKYHSYYGMQIETEDTRTYYGYASDEAASALRDAFKALNGWIFKRLRDEYEYQMSDETVDDNIRANEYTFTESGKREG